MFKTTNQHQRYWHERKIDWNQAYASTWNHPHRAYILSALTKWRWNTLLEIGCASGPNLIAIRKAFPTAILGGTDINEDAIMAAKGILGITAVLQAGDAYHIFHSDSSSDVMLTDACLIYIGDIYRAIEEIKRVGRKHFIFVEFHSTSWVKRLALKWATGYNAYDYEKVLTNAGFYDIELTKLPDLWDGEPWKTYGYLITAKIAKV